MTAPIAPAAPIAAYPFRLPDSGLVAAMDPADVPAALFKIVAPDGGPLNGGSGMWPLPVGDVPGDWREVVGELEPCRNGLHLCSAAQLQTWIPVHTGSRYAPDVRPFAVYRVETAGPIIDAGGKYVAGRVRLLPGPRTLPDLTRAVRRRDNAKQRAARAMQRALGSIASSAYSRTLSTAELPKSHPLYAAVAGYRAVETVYQAACVKAESTYQRTVQTALAQLARS